jgi:hypothetical protein
MSLTLLSSLHRCEEQAVMAIHALDFGDYAMAICLFKRALAALNACFAVIGTEEADGIETIRELRDDMRIRLFDLREIWLRVISDCREDTERDTDEET